MPIPTLPLVVWDKIFELLPPQERHVLSQRLSKDFRDNHEGLRLPRNVGEKYTLKMSKPMPLWLLKEGFGELIPSRYFEAKWEAKNRALKVLQWIGPFNIEYKRKITCLLDWGEA